MNTRGNENLRQALAAEYALGTLRGPARRRFEAWMREDAELARLAMHWGSHLAPLGELIPEVAPPARVWESIVGRLPVLAPLPRTTGSWWQSLVFWKGLAGALGAVALFSLALPVLRPGPAPQTAQAQAAYVATIEDTASHQPVAVLLMPESGNEVVLKLVAAHPAVPTDRVLQLWIANPAGSGVVSAGLTAPPSGDQAVRFTVPDPAHLRASPVLGLSIEPPGGSPTATHVLGFGKWIRLSS